MVGVPSGDLASEFDGATVLCVSHDVDGDVSDDGHVLGAMAFSDARRGFLEGDVENPMDGALDPPMGAHRVSGLFGRERA